MVASLLLPASDMASRPFDMTLLAPSALSALSGLATLSALSVLATLSAISALVALSRPAPTFDSSSVSSSVLLTLSLTDDTGLFFISGHEFARRTLVLSISGLLPLKASWGSDSAVHWLWWRKRWTLLAKSFIDLELGMWSPPAAQGELRSSSMFSLAAEMVRSKQKSHYVTSSQRTQ
jgi:hypothetical protein